MPPLRDAASPMFLKASWGPRWPRAASGACWRTVSSLFRLPPVLSQPAPVLGGLRTPGGCIAPSSDERRSIAMRVQKQCHCGLIAYDGHHQRLPCLDCCDPDRRGVPHETTGAAQTSHILNATSRRVHQNRRERRGAVQRQRSRDPRARIPVPCIWFPVCQGYPACKPGPSSPAVSPPRFPPRLIVRRSSVST